jgi:hypothetical protein
MHRAHLSSLGASDVSNVYAPFDGNLLSTYFTGPAETEVFLENVSSISTTSTAGGQNTTVMIPEFSEVPISHLSTGFAMGAYDVLGARLLTDHIGYPVGNLAPFPRLNVKLPGLSLASGGGATPHWSGNLIMRQAPPRVV